jgi:ubiquinone/menaquinone biosynthesis C-methylase UbiE
MFCVKKVTGPAFLALLFSAATLAQQTTMPRPTTARTLESRITGYERTERDAWMKPDEVVKALELKSGDVVADIGAGSGYFSRRFATAVAPGKVYAVDIDAEVLGYLKDRAAQENLSNLVTVVSKEDDPLLPAGAVDLAFFCDATHHISGRVSFFGKVAQGLKARGRMVVIDFPPGSPRTGHAANELIPQSQMISEAEQAGFRFVKSHELLLPGFYFLVFEKK